MTISRATIDKLGIKLYDSPSAVVSELIANAYDVDAEKVTIEIPLDRWLATIQDGKLADKGFEIVVRDDGIGMKPDIINDFYLRIGTDPRKDPKRGPRTKDKKRLRIGRKGIGKRALGHKNIKNTLIYTQLAEFEEEDQFISKVAKTVEEACEFVEKGFEYICDLNDVKIFRKRK